MNGVFMALLAASALTSVAYAADDPPLIKGANDLRIRTVDYSDKIVTRINSTGKVPVVLVYGETEIPKMIAGLEVMDVTPKEGLDAKTSAAAADAAHAACEDPKGPKWCVDRHANELTLQPVKDDTGSVLVVTTEKPADDGTVTRHHYAYELHTRTGHMIADDKDKAPVDTDAYFRITYTYSAEDTARRQAAYRVAHKDDGMAAQKAKAADEMTMAQFGGARSYQWTGGDSKECKELGKPTRVSDNGQFTTLYFPPSVPISIPNRVNDDGTETLINWHPKKALDSGDWMILEEVPKKFVLRRGEKLACLFERDPSAPLPLIQFTGTSSPRVVREGRK